MSGESEEVEDSYLAAEVRRAIQETRAALGALAKRCCLPAPLMSISTLIDRIKVEISQENGDSAFELKEEEETVAFRANTVRHIISEIASLADQIGLDDPEENLRARQLAINLFVIHELLHIRQNFPHFATVTKIKAGFAGIGLPMLDVAADTVSAWVCAHVEAERLGETDELGILRHYANALVLAYAIGTCVYDGRTKPEKRQRVLGLIVSAVLVQGKVDGRLDVDEIYESWQPMSPLIVLNLERAGAFNAMVIDKIPGLLLNDRYDAPADVIREFWDSVGQHPILRTLELASELLVHMRAIKRS